MRSFFENKTWVLFMSILALGALTVLSVSLKNVSFNAPQPIGRQDAAPFKDAPVAVKESLGEVSLWSQIALWLALTVLVVLIAVLLSPEARKKMFRIFVRVAITYWALYYLLKSHPEILSIFNLNFNTTSASGGGADLSEIPPPVFTPPKEILFLSYLVSVLIVLTFVYLGWKLYRTWKELNPGIKQKPLSEIARIARLSLHDLSSGRESTDVILNCYFRMSDVVGNKKNMQRGLSMTPAEFATNLEGSGLPGGAVQRLTRLFESVRYGSQKTGPKEINEAVACLTTILQYCGEPV